VGLARALARSVSLTVTGSELVTVTVARCVLAAIVSLTVAGGVLAAGLSVTVAGTVLANGVPEHDFVNDGDGGDALTESVSLAGSVSVTAGIGHVSGGRIPPGTTEQAVVPNAAGVAAA
jgi:hypothetical protein